jgi:hypothetical protein
MDEIKRVCGLCKEIFYINRNNINEAIYYDKKTYHSKCFVDICGRRAAGKSKIAPKWEWVLENMETIKNESMERFKTSLDKEDVYRFILDTYDLTVIPTTVWQKMSDIYAGTFKGMSIGIPPEHLLDMWKRKINTLNAIAAKNSANGKVMDSGQRLNYDLSVLVNKYDGYLKWLERQKILRAEQAMNKNKNTVSESIGYDIIKNNQSIDKDDILDLVDDIFG